MACFNCLNTNFKIRKLPHPKDHDNIKQNLDACRNAEGITKNTSSYNVNHIEILHVNTTYIGEIYLTEQFSDAHSTTNNNASSPQPIDTLFPESSQSDEADISNM